MDRLPQMSYELVNYVDFNEIEPDLQELKQYLKGIELSPVKEKLHSYLYIATLT